jgi:hypothetical protein
MIDQFALSFLHIMHQVWDISLKSAPLSSVIPYAAERPYYAILLM